MSDPVTNVEIEDVLSSIRRLVSTDDRPEKEGEVMAEAATPADKLVLTPALRVDDSETYDEVDADEDQPHAEAEDAEGEFSEEEKFEEEASFIATEADDDLIEDDEETDVAEADSSDTAEDHAGDDEGEEDQHGSELSSHIAEIEAVVAAREDEWEPDGDPEDENAAQPMTSLPWQDEESVAEDTEIESDEAPDEHVSDFVPETPDVAPETEGLDPYIPEEDEAEEAGFYAGETLPPASSGNAFVAGDDLLEDGDDAVLDEESLRDLVAEIVREELQGSLGERITRNVRKLVRREIQRALAAQELE